MTLPNFLIVGAAKSGTTSLYHYLRQNPQIFMSSLKEPRFSAFEGQPPSFSGIPRVPILYTAVAGATILNRLVRAIVPKSARSQKRARTIDSNLRRVALPEELRREILEYYRVKLSPLSTAQISPLPSVSCTKQL